MLVYLTFKLYLIQLRIAIDLTFFFTYLLIEPTISFRLRIRHSDRIFDGQKQLRASIVFAHLKPGQTQVLSGRRWVWGRCVYVSALRLDDGELLIILSPDSASTAIALREYLRTLSKSRINTFSNSLKVINSLFHPSFENRPPTLYFV